MVGGQAPNGEDLTPGIVDRLDEADFGLLLLSNRYFGRSFIQRYQRVPPAMSTRLLREQVARHVEALRSQTVLTTLQAARLEAIVDTMAEDGQFLLRDALVAAKFPEGDARGQDAFQDFRKRVNQAAADAGIELALELDSRKTPPDQRRGWFTGGDPGRRGHRLLHRRDGPQDRGRPPRRLGGH